MSDDEKEITDHEGPCLTTCTGCCPTRTVPKKYAITVITALWGLFTNIERAIILPTMWLYFITYWSEDTAKKFYGATMAAFSLSVLLFTPLYGYAAHRGVQTKYLVVLANLIEILGNLAYLIARQPWVVLVGRFISGIGGSCDTPMYADLARTTTVKERTPYVAVTYVFKQIGIVFGPACTLLMHKLHWQMGNFKLSVYNGPGLLMACLWCLHTILVILFYPFVKKPQHPGSDVQSEKQELILNDRTKKRNRGCCEKECEKLKVYRTYPVLAMFVMVLTAYFCVMSLETVLSPVVNHYFNWNEVKVSYVYLCASGVLIIMCFVLHFLSKRIEDRRLALVGFILLVLAYALLTCITAFIQYTTELIGISLIMTGILIHVIGMPLALAVTESLYTKKVPRDDLDRALSYLRCVSNLGYLLGPLEGGVFVAYSYLVFLGNFVLSVVSLGLIACRYSAFRVDEDASKYEKIVEQTLPAETSKK
ncbi:unnamed protein product [Schistocephalus solidus]|uniref:Major facilitator superfamily domain-containing protein 8 n=1 Tax=Schistocephalus solidus TaxID=70667 RepID=A0A0X3PDB2_SCHSO|nr:unnamed protein product [Schistocephalus solidus]